MDVSKFIFHATVGGVLAGASRHYLGWPAHLSAALGVVPVGLALLRVFMNGGVYRGKERIPGKTVIVTGANTGIGKETALELARRGARVILACRDVAKGEAAAKEIVSKTGNPNMICRRLDLNSFDSVREFAKNFNESEDRLDILINNAGVMWCPRTLSQDGLEMQLATNHFGHFLLTNLLLDKLKKCAPSRIIIVSSLAHRNGVINFDDLNSEKSYDRSGNYRQSKLANVLHALELSKRLEGTGVTANSLHPGVVETELGRYISEALFFRLLLPVMLPVLWLCVKSPVQGAQTTLRLALDPALDTVSGKYFSDCCEKLPSKPARDEATAKRLWEVSEKITRKA